MGLRGRWPPQLRRGRAGRDDFRTPLAMVTAGPSGEAERPFALLTAGRRRLVLVTPGNNDFDGGVRPMPL
jgi:hypothetical protein